MEITGTFSGSVHIEPKEIAEFFNALSPETREQFFGMAIRAYPQLMGEFMKVMAPQQSTPALLNPLFWWLPQTNPR
jgi:hypothetical protein